MLCVSAGGHPGEEPICLAGEVVVDLDLVAVRARRRDRVEVAPAGLHEVRDGAHEPSEDEADDEAECEDTEKAAGVGREEVAEQEPQNRPRTAPCTIPINAARPVVRRPETCST